MPSGGVSATAIPIELCAACAFPEQLSSIMRVADSGRVAYYLGIVEVRAFFSETR